MSSVLTFLVLQFHGRFVFAEDKTAKDLTVFAVDPRTSAGISSKPHDPFLTIRGAHVDRKGPTGKSERVPTHRITSTSPAPYDGARLLWQITDCQIDVLVDGGFEWLATGDILPVADLASGTDRPFNRKFLDQKPAPPVTALVKIHSGKGSGFHEFGKNLTMGFFDYDYVRYGDEQKVKDAGRLADMVEIAMPMRGSHVDISFGPNEGIRVLADPLLKNLPIVNVAGVDVRAVILNFSNLCTAAASRIVDCEFAAFYDLLDNPPARDDRWIPRVNLPATTGVSGGAHVETIGHPFGDCYLSAKISF